MAARAEGVRDFGGADRLGVAVDDPEDFDGSSDLSISALGRTVVREDSGFVRSPDSLGAADAHLG